ncbi:Hypothetical protein A7982_07016 [Minicystis rosea]|nr:Hypothetical protein A7982_07016 [Minicystis rosea]
MGSRGRVELDIIHIASPRLGRPGAFACAPGNAVNGVHENGSIRA